MHVGSITLCEPDEQGWYCVQIDGLGEGGCGAWFETQPTFGFASRPVDRDALGSCNVIYSFDGSAWVGHDRRYSVKCPTLTQGSSAHWNSDGASLLLDTVTHTASLYVPRGASAHEMTLGQDQSGNEIFEVLCADGSRLKSAASGWSIQHVGLAKINVGATKTDITGSATVSLDLSVGGPAGMPVVNATAFGTLLATLGTALNAATPVTPYEIALQSALLALIGAFAGTCPTTMLRSV